MYLAIDLGGTNFRVCSIQLNGDTTFNLIQSKVAIPRQIMVSKTSRELFSFLANQIKLFLEKHHQDRFVAHIRRRQTLSSLEGFRDEQIFRLGFTFSFPIHQTGINKGTLMRWTKGFDIPDAVGQDVCALLQQEIDLLGLPVNVAALVNDTVGTLMARSYTSPGKTKTLLGAIFGTGTNGAYIEKLSSLTKPLEGDYDASTGEMVINTEWGSFDNDLKVLPKTSYDAILDKNSINPGVQMFEKRISGMFLGEILRITLVSLIEDPSVSLFQNTFLKDFNSNYDSHHRLPLFKKWAIDSSILSIAEADNSAELHILRNDIKKVFGISGASFEDAYAVKRISNAIAKRAARLAGAAIGAIVIHTGQLSKTETVSSRKPFTNATTKTNNFNFTPGEPNTNCKKSVVPGLVTNDEDMIDIGVDGSLMEFYPDFEVYMREALRAVDCLGGHHERRIRIGAAKDGSGLGAALIALVATSMDQKKGGRTKQPACFP